MMSLQISGPDLRKRRKKLMYARSMKEKAHSILFLEGLDAY
jgi:hypothetical protein